MSFYGFNRAAINGGVAGIIAGAALVVAVSGFTGESTKVILPTTTVTATSVVVVTGFNTILGNTVFVTLVSGSATPALLQLQTVELPAFGMLKATYTDVWVQGLSQNDATGFITQPGTGFATSSTAVTANSRVTVGFASNTDVVSFVTADASVKLNGQGTLQRDGYSQGYITSTMIADGLKTALGHVSLVGVSSCNTGSIKIHGGAAIIISTWHTAAIAAIDAVGSYVSSNLTAAGHIIVMGRATFNTGSNLIVEPLKVAYGVPAKFTGISSTQVVGRLALLSAAQSGVLTTVTAQWINLKEGISTFTGNSLLVADSRLALLGQTNLLGQSSLLVNGGLLHIGVANSVAQSILTALGYSNIEANDPDNRTMYRAATSRDMARVFVDKEMWRTV